MNEATGERAIDQHAAPPVLYPRFVRRLNALCIDVVVLTLLSGVVFAVVFQVQGFPVVRTGVVVLWWLALVLYDPILVWRVGGTVGHARLNLRVVDDRTGTNLSLPKALVRYVLKTVLGLFSFVSMNLSQRHQAVHDILTRSSVRIRDPEKAKPYHVVSLAASATPTLDPTGTPEVGTSLDDAASIDPPDNSVRTVPLLLFGVALLVVIVLSVM